MLKVNDLRCGYGDLDVIRGVSFELKDNEIKVLLSLNGGGKTTLLKTLSGLIPIKGGNIFLDDIDISHSSPRERVKHGMLYIPEWGVFPSLTVKENLIIAASTIRGRSRYDVEGALTHFPDLKNRLSDKAGSLSGGQRKMLMLAMAAVSGAKVLLMDEPSSGLSPSYVDKVIETIKILKDEGMTFLIAEQNSSFSEISDELMILELGSIVLKGKYENIKRNDEIKRKFFSL
ncbi:MAG: ATP-binding cassette domain-containing protein [Candidatus Parvarchaeota archaeon]